MYKFLRNGLKHMLMYQSHIKKKILWNETKKIKRNDKNKMYNNSNSHTDFHFSSLHYTNDFEIECRESQTMAMYIMFFNSLHYYNQIKRLFGLCCQFGEKIYIWCESQSFPFHISME